MIWRHFHRGQAQLAPPPNLHAGGHIERTMSGYIHITRLRARTGTDNRAVTDYQVNYVTSGVSYAASYDEEELTEFLRTKVPLDAAQCIAIITEVNNVGHANIADIHIPKSQASAMGMEQLPDDF
jgi:hypothetical protein